MERVTSSDGTQIAFEKTGSGPPLVLVHGISDDHSYWELVQPALAQYFTVFAIDRRGRGQSGDTSDYSLEREFEDVKAVVDRIKQPVTLLGHSHGGIVSLESALLSANLSKIILYEPPILDKTEEFSNFLDKILRDIEANLKEGKNEQALLLFLEELLTMSSDEINISRSTPYWKVMVSAAPTLPRELRADEEYRFDAARFKDLKLPALLISGTESTIPLKKAINKLDEGLSNSRVISLEGQAHDAARTAPELFANEVIKLARVTV